MKTYFAYDVNHRLLRKLLIESGQPLVGIKFYGPAVNKVSIACIALSDAASDGVVEGILAEVSQARPTSEATAEREEQLRKEFGQ